MAGTKWAFVNWIELVHGRDQVSFCEDGAGPSSSITTQNLLLLKEMLTVREREILDHEINWYSVVK
jgi:hypothetical protein